MEKTLYDNIRQVEATHWWYKARREIIFDWVQAILNVHTNPSVMDLGCGTGFNITYLHDLGYENITGVDFSSDALAYCSARNLTKLICGDANHLPFHATSYEVILALDIIEHLEDDEKTLRDIFRVLKPGGSLIIFVPAYKFLWSFQDEISHHVRRYTAHELRSKALTVGFEIQKITYANTFLFPVIWAGRLVLKIFRRFFRITSESQMNPSQLNTLLYKIFRAELPLLRLTNFPFGVSILCVCNKPEAGHKAQQILAQETYSQ